MDKINEIKIHTFLKRLTKLSNFTYTNQERKTLITKSEMREGASLMPSQK